MVIAGGDWQIELIKKAKQMGHFVICSNLYEDSPAFPYADACEVANVLDKGKNLEIARKYMPDAVISDQSDIAVPTVAYLNEQLGTRGIGIEKANLFTDKSLQREYSRANGIDIPDYCICRTPEDADPMLEKYGKIIIKPIDSQSSRGVFTIESKEQLRTKYEETLSWSNRDKAFLAEQYIAGAEFTIDGLVINGHHYPLCVSVKEMYPSNPNISMVQSYSYLSDKYDYDLLRKTNKNLIEKIGLPMGLTHSEYRFHDGRFFLIEAGARGGGSNLSGKIVPFMSEIDNYEYLIKEALEEEVDESYVANKVFNPDKYVIMRFFDFDEGTVRSVEGLDYLRSNPMLIDYQLKLKAGDVLEHPKYGRLRPGHFIIGSDNKEAVIAESEKILDTVKVVYDNV